MKAKTISKRVLSVILCTVMLFSCWVFTAPQAEAADPGNYNVRVYFSQNGSVGSFTGDVGGTPSDKLGVIVRYKPNNGTGTSSNSTTKVCWNNNESGVSKEITGFPDLLYLCYDENRVVGSKYAHVTKMQVKGTGQSSWTTLWEGDLQVGSVMNPYGISVDMNGTIKNDWIDTDKECKAVDAGSGWADKFPYPTLNEPTYNDTSGVNAPNSATVTTAASFNSTDQYGVTLGGTFSVGYELTIHQYYINSWVDQTLPNDSIEFNTSTGEIKPLKANGYARHDNYVRATGTWSYKSGTTYTSSSQWVKMTYPSYTVTYNYNYNTTPSTWTVNTSNKTAEYIPYATATAAESSTNSALWGDLAPTAPTPDASHQYYYTNAGHYTNGSYSNPSTGIMADTPVTMSGYTTNSGHTWGSYAQFTGTQNGVFTPADYHRATCTNFSQTHYKYQLHQWGTPTFTFADNGKTATVKRQCTTNGCKLEQLQEVTCTSAVKTPATCTVKGTTTYTATSPWGDGTTKTKDVQDIAALTHSWKTPTFAFAVDGKTANATRVCNRDATHTETQAAVVTSKVKTPPTCTNKGTTTYTATSPWGDGATGTKDVQDISALSHNTTGQAWQTDAAYHWKNCNNGCGTPQDKAEHDWNAWVDNGDGTHSKTCKVCGYEVSGEHSNYTPTVHAPTCTEQGYTTYTCDTCGYAYDDDYVDATGHDAAKLDTDTIAYESNGTTHWKTCDWCDQAVYNNNGTWTIGTDGHNPVTTKRDATTLVTPATCTEAGIYHHVCSVCAEVLSTEYQVSDDGVGKALGHNWQRWEDCDEEHISELSGLVPVVFECQNGCGKYCASYYDDNEQKYVADPIHNGTSPKSAEIVSYSDSIPTPNFNEFEEPFDPENPYVYAERKASLRVRLSEQGDTTQAMRFSGHLKASNLLGKVDFNADPNLLFNGSALKSLEEIRANKDAYTDNTIIDFGFVFTQARFIRTAKTVIDYDLMTLDNIGTDYRIYRMSVVGNNLDNYNQGKSMDNWKGLTMLNYDEDLTFNLVIDVNEKNYQATYCARTYIIYKYRGDIIALYDQPGINYEDETHPYYSHDSVYNQAYKVLTLTEPTDLVKRYLENKIINNTVTQNFNDSKGDKKVDYTLKNPPKLDY